MPVGFKTHGWQPGDSDNAMRAAASNLIVLLALTVPVRLRYCKPGNPHGHNSARGGKAPNYSPADVALSVKKRWKSGGLQPSPGW